MAGAFQANAFQHNYQISVGFVVPTSPKMVFYVPLRKRRMVVAVRTKSVRVN